MHLLSIDIETTGLDPTIHQTIEVAMVYTNTLDPSKKRESFSTLVEHELYVGDPFALSMNAAILREIADIQDARKKGLAELRTKLVTTDQLTGQLELWFRYLWEKIIGEKVKFTPTGKNVGAFDLAFLRMLPRWKAPFHHRCLDVGPMFWNPLDDGPMPDLKECRKRAGLDPQVDHRALSDAHAVLDVIDASYSLVLHEKSGYRYARMGTVINATNSAPDNTQMVAYMNGKSDKFVREIAEFEEKFTKLI